MMWLWADFLETLARATCRVLGHSRKVRRKLYCDLCWRCNRVVAPTEKSYRGE